MKYYIILIISIVLFSCNRKAGEKDTRTVFRYNESAGITSLDPAFAKDQANIWATNQLFNGLVQLNDKLEVKPCIAKSWKILNKGRTYIFYLRTDVYFHNSHLFKNGKTRKVKASDFVYSFNRIIDKKIACPGAWIFNNVKQNNDGSFCWTAVNDSCFKIDLKQPFPPFLSLLTMQYCSVVPYEIVEFYAKDFRKNPVGTGPFKFKMWRQNIKLVLVKNKNYFEKNDKGKKLPYLDAVSISFIIDKQTVFFKFVKGDIDFMSGIDASYKDELLTHNGGLNPKYKDKFKIITQPYLNTEYLGFLVDTSLDVVKQSPLRIMAVRQAINYGFDREKMIRYLRNNIGTPALNGFIPKGMPCFDSTKVTGYNYNPDKARKLLADAGFVSGENLSDITLTTTSSYLDLCKYIQHQLSEIGINIKIDVNPPATLREVIAKSKVVFFRGSWIADYADAENYLSLFYSKNFCPKGPNYTHFSDKKFDALYEKAQKEINDSVRFIYYQKMDNIIMKQAIVVPLYYDQVLRFTQNNIKGLGINSMNLLSLKKVKK